MVAWATMDDVVDVTGREATAESLAAAHTQISILVGTGTTASDNGLVSSRNLSLLQQAVAFQAVWLDAHPDALEVMDVQGVSQDGLNAQYASAHAHILAPWAQRCIRRLSWMKASLRVRRSTGYGSNRGNRDSAVADDQYEWTPM